MPRLKNHLPCRACNHKSLCALRQDLHAPGMRARLNVEPCTEIWINCNASRGHMTNCPLFFKGHWHSPCIALMAGICCARRLCKSLANCRLLWFVLSSWAIPTLSLWSRARFYLFLPNGGILYSAWTRPSVSTPGLKLWVINRWLCARLQ